MADTVSVKPNLLARQIRESLVRQTEINYKNDLIAAAKARDDARREAVEAKAQIIKNAHDTLDKARLRLRESRDRIEAGLRKKDLEAARNTQERLIYKAESDRVKAFKQAELLGRRLVVEAAERRNLAIKQAYADEKRMRQEAAQVLKSARKAPRTGSPGERKAQQKQARENAENERRAQVKAAQEAAEAKKRAEKAAAAERSAQKALDKSRGKSKTPADRQTAKAATVEPVKPTAAPEAVKPVSQPEAIRTATPPPALKAEAKPEPVKLVKPPEPVKLVTQSEPLKMMAPPEPPKPLEKAAAKTEDQPPSKDATSKKAEEAKSILSQALAQSGLIRLVIALDVKEPAPALMLDFENALRKIPDLKLIMVGGSSREGTQILVKAEKAVALAQTLRALPMVESISEKSGEMIIKLKPAPVS